MKQTTSMDGRLELWIAALLSLLFLLPFTAYAAEPEAAVDESTLVSISEPDGGGTLLLKTATPGQYLPAPVVDSEVELKVTGLIVRARVTQRFVNPTGHCVEGIYLFPLPENAAVDTLRMIVGTRTIEGEIREKEEARRVYEEAKSAGQKASLVEQLRPNTFTTSISGLLPGEHLEIQIEYQNTLELDRDGFRLRFPMVVAPRYHPAPPATKAGDVATEAGATAGGWVPLPQNKVPASPQVPESAAPRVKLTIDLDTGFAVDRIDSSYHRVAITQLGATTYRVVLEDGSTSANRDFELVWTPRLGSAPQAALFTESIGSETYALMMIMPPSDSTPVVRIPRETIFIIDTSGSMEGTSLDQAKEALLRAIDRLGPADAFNVIEFNSETYPLFSESRNVDRQSISEAKEFVAGLESRGGTEMLGALKAALGGPPTTPGRLRQVVFITDGQVGNELELFTYIESHLGDSRLFTVGIGSAPNSYFMTTAARSGRGTFTYIGEAAEVAAKTDELLRKIESPALTDVSITFSDPAAEVWPSRIPDLYSGQPVIAAARLSVATAAVSIRGRIASNDWAEKLSVGGPKVSSSGSTGVARLWARQKIASITDGLGSGADPAIVRQDVVAVALQHHLVSDYTSLVAVDKTPVGVDVSRCVPVRIPIGVPKGSSSENLPASLPQTATPWVLLVMAGVVVILAASGLRWV